MWPQKDNFEAHKTAGQPYRKRDAPQQQQQQAAARTALTPSKPNMRLPKLAAASTSGMTAAATGGAAAGGTTPSSARKRTFDALVATDTPPQSPSRTFSSLSTTQNASSHDLADSYRPTLYAAFLANVFADSTNTAAAAGRIDGPHASGKRSPTTVAGAPQQSNSASYNQLIAQLRISTHSRPSGSASLSQLGQWLSALTHHVSKLDHRSHAELVEAVLAIPWPTLGPAISRAWTTFICSLLSARAEWLGAVLEHAVQALGYHSEWHEIPLSAAPTYSIRSATRRQVYTRVHALLRSLLSLIPTLPTTLFPLLLSHLPPKRGPLRTQGLYILNLLRVTEYAPELTEGIWAAVVHRVMSIDVEVQMEVEDLEDDSGRLDFLDAPAATDEEGMEVTGIIVDVLDRPLSEEDADDVDADSDVDPTDAIGDDILNDPGTYDGSGEGEDGTRLDELSSGDESSDSEGADRHGPPKSAAQRRADAMLRQQEAVRSIKKNVKKLDVVMQILYEYLRRANASYMGLGAPVSGYFEEVPSLSSSGSLGRITATAPSSRGASASATGAKERRNSGDADEDLLMVAGEMEEDSPDTPLAGNFQLGAGIKLRRVESPTASLSSSSSGPAQAAALSSAGALRSGRGSNPLFEPTPSPSPGVTPAALPSPASLALAQPARRTNLFHILLGIFDRLVLPTFRSRHVQFVMFWFSSLDAEYTDTFLGMLLSKSLYSGPAAVAAAAAAAGGKGGRGGGRDPSIEDFLYDDDAAPGGPGGSHPRHEASSPILRKAAASYVASLVSRASFIGTLHTRAVVLNLCAFLDAYLEQYALACAHASAQGLSFGPGLALDGGNGGGVGMAGGPPPPGSPVHEVFYSIAQALFYIFCFRWRDLEMSASGSSGGVEEQHSKAGAPNTKRGPAGGEPSSFSTTGPKSYSSSVAASEAMGGAHAASSSVSSSSIGSVAANYKTNGFSAGGGALAFSHASSSGSSSSGTGAGPHGIDDAFGGGIGTGAGAAEPGSSSFNASNRLWCDGLDVVQRVITSSLNPLRYCSPTVVRQFAYVAKVTGLVYCYSIIEANNRAIGTASASVSVSASRAAAAAANKSVSMTASGTLQPLSAADRVALRSGGRGREGTPMGAGLSSAARGVNDDDSGSDEDDDDEDDDDDELPQPAGSERLDGFFPFDPYRLQNSMGFVEGLYRQWEDVAPEANDDDDDSSESGSESDSDSDSASDSDSDSDDSNETDEDEDVDMSPNRPGKKKNNEKRLVPPPPSGAVLIPRGRGAGREGSHSGSGSGSDGARGEREQRFAQSFEAMSLSPNP
ncbi:DNA independent RNA polymerase I transcription factor [Tilletia horrida]|nr:DNA independent RNA polymerase I transcription factor [Tilletia horrida]